MRRTVALLALLIFSCTAARADDASKERKIRELFKISQVDASMTQARESVIAYAHKLVDSAIKPAIPLSERQQKIANEFYDQAIKLASEQYDWSAIEPDFIKLYATTYTEEEIDGILAFYRTPAGQSMLNKLPEINAGRLKIFQDRDMQIEPRLRALFENFLRRLDADAQIEPAK